MEKELCSTLASRTRREWLERFEQNDVPAAPAHDMAEVLNDPQVKHLDLVEEVEHPEAGKLRFVGPPVRFVNRAGQKSRPPPLPGEQTATLLAEVGYGSEEIERLKNEGVIYLSPHT